MNKSIFYIAIFVVVSGCTDQYSYITTSLLENKSAHDVVLKYYENGAENVIKRVQSAQNSIIELYQDANDGKGQGFKAFSFQSDSLVLEFSTGVRLVHYGASIIGSNPNAISFAEPRNFFNEASWNLENLSKHKKRLEYEFTYVITQSDFEQAN